MARQILVIDDSSTMRQCIEWSFAFEDFVVASAQSFQEAISDIDVVQPDVVLLDHELNDTSLDEAVNDIANKLGRQPTIILLHQHDMPLTQSELERVHASAQVPKPFETQRLIDTVKWSLGMPITPSIAASRAYKWTPPTESPDVGSFEIPEPPSIPVPSAIGLGTPEVPAQEPPAIIAPPPVEAQEPPAIIAPPPVEAQEPPAVIAPPPVEAQEPPAVIAPPPVEAQEPPAVIAPPPVEAQEPPAIIAPPPVEAQEPPAIIAPPPVEAQEPPAIIAPPPVEAQEPPAIIAPPPVEAQEPPAIIAPPPVEAQEPPAVIAPPPVEAQEPPAIIAPQTSEEDEPQLVAAPPVFHAPPPPVVEAQDAGPSQHAPFHPEHEPEQEQEEPIAPMDVAPAISQPTGTTEIDVGQLSLDDDELDASSDLDDGGLEPDDFFAAPSESPTPVAAVVDAATSELLEAIPADDANKLEALAHQIVERVAWEIIPDIVEKVVRERLNRDD